MRTPQYVWRRRDRRLVDGTYGGPVAPTDLTALIANIGGNGVVVAAYDSRAGIGQSGNLVSQWDDARGPSGYGPSLSASGAARPVWDPAALTLTGDGSNTIMATPGAGSALFDLAGQFAIYYVGTLPATGGAVCGLLDTTASFSRALALGAANAGNIRSSNQSLTVTSVTPGGTTRRISIASKDATNVYVETPNQAAASSATTTPAGNNILYLFGDRPSNIGTWSACVVRALLLLNRKNAGDATAIRDWATLNHSAVAA